MVKFKVPLKDILGRAYYQYELSSSNYNPHIDDTITITCTCKNILGNPIPNKELTLMMNGVEQGTSTTNELGIATWSITFGDWGNKHFHIGNATLDLVVTGWKQVQTLSSDRVRVFTDGKYCKIRIGGTFITSTSQGEYNLGTINNLYRPSDNYTTNYTTATSNYFPVYLKTDDTVVHLYKQSTSSSNISVYCTLYYPLKDPLY